MRSPMQTMLPLLAILLCLSPAIGRVEENLPLAEKVSAEKLLLTEQYHRASQKCRESSRKRMKDLCLDQKKKEFLQNIADLERTPRAYFAAQAQRDLDKKALRERNTRP